MHQFIHNRKMTRSINVAMIESILLVDDRFATAVLRDGSKEEILYTTARELADQGTVVPAAADDKAIVAHRDAVGSFFEIHKIVAWNVKTNVATPVFIDDIGNGEIGIIQPDGSVFDYGTVHESVEAFKAHWAGK